MTRPRPIWPAAISDKLVDWQAFASVGGTNWTRGKRVLDIGPGRALDAQVLAEEAASYYVLDVSQEVLDWVEFVEPKVIPACGQAENMLFPDNFFDTVLDFSSIDNCEEPTQCYMEAFRVLKPHGLLLTTFANRAVLGHREDQHTQQFADLVPFLKELGFWIRRVDGEMAARAMIAAQKYGEMIKGKLCKHCDVTHTEGEIGAP